MTAGVNATVSTATVPFNDFCLFLNQTSQQLFLGQISSQSYVFSSFSFYPNLTLVLPQLVEGEQESQQGFLILSRGQTKPTLSATQLRTVYFVPVSDYVTPGQSIQKTLKIVDPISPSPSPEPSDPTSSDIIPSSGSEDSTSSTSEQSSSSGITPNSTTSSSSGSSTNPSPSASSQEDDQGNDDNLNWLWITLGVVGGLLVVGGFYYWY